MTIAKSPAPGAGAPGADAAKAQATTSKTPGAPARTPGALAKASDRGVGPAPGTLAKAAGACQAARPAGAPAPVAADGGLSAASVGEVLKAIDAAQGVAKIRSVVRLADSLGQHLPIEHINHFLRALKKKVVERAQTEGVPVPLGKAPPASAPLTNGRPAAPGGAAAKGPPAAPAPAAQASRPRPPAAGAPAAPAAAKAAVAKVAPAAAPRAPAAANPAAANPAAAKQRPPQHKPAQPPPQTPRQPPPQPAATPPASPPPGGDDALFVLVGELGDAPVVSDGALNEARLGDVLKRLWDGVARKPKDWIAAWQAMTIPVDKQAEALQKFLNMTFMQPEDPERAPMVVAELVKAHKVKMRSVEEVLVAFGHNLDGILALNEDAWHVYAQFLVHVFPKPAAAGWGWSRVGWSWQSWWKFVEQCIQTLEPSRASDVLCMILRLVQDREGQAIQEVQGWAEGDKLSRVVAKISELGACESAEALEKLAMQGVTVAV